MLNTSAKSPYESAARMIRSAYGVSRSFHVNHSLAHTEQYPTIMLPSTSISIRSVRDAVSSPLEWRQDFHTFPVMVDRDAPSGSRQSLPIRIPLRAVLMDPSPKRGEAAEFRIHRPTKRHRNGGSEKVAGPRVVPREANTHRQRVF